MKYLPHGTKVRINSVLIGGLISVSLPSQTRGEAEVTDSDSGGDREFLAGLRDHGSVELTFRHDPQNMGQQDLYDNYNAAPGSAVVAFEIELPDAATPGAGGPVVYSFDGFVSAAPAGALPLADDTAAELSATIRVSGAVTISS